MTTSRKLPILLATSTIVLSMFAVAPAAASSSVKQKCVSPSTASETFRLKASSDSLTQSYKVSVKAKVCLTYTMVSKLVRGKQISQPEVSVISEEMTVSHSGYLPERDGKAAIDLLPRGAGVGSLTLVESLTPRAVSGGTPGFVFTRYSNYHENFVYLGSPSDTAWGQLIESGFSCSRGKCRPVKKSVVLTYTQALTIPSSSRVFLNVSVGVNVGRDIYRPPVNIQRYTAKQSYLYWDNGDPCGTEFASACTAIKPLTSFKSQDSSLNHFDAWAQTKTFVGIPSSLREK
jgi:hypothetical protein